MRYERDFTIGLRETQAFHVLLTLERWWKGLLGFGAAGALAAYLYIGMLFSDLILPGQIAIIAAAAVVTALLVALGMVLSTRRRVRVQLRRSGKERYVQQTAIDAFGVHVTVGKDRAKLGFDKLRRVQETRGAFYLFLSDSQAWSLPKAQMEDRAAECAQLRQIFRTVIERGRLRLRKS